MNDTNLGKARTTRRSSRRCLFHRIWSHVFAESGERCPRPFQMLRTSSRAFTCAEECALSKLDAENQTATELKAKRSRCTPSQVKAHLQTRYSIVVLAQARSSSDPNVNGKGRIVRTILDERRTKGRRVCSFRNET